MGGTIKITRGPSEAQKGAKLTPTISENCEKTLLTPHLHLYTAAVGLRTGSRCMMLVGLSARLQDTGTGPSDLRFFSLTIDTVLEKLFVLQLSVR